MPSPQDKEAAETLAIAALGFIAQNTELLERFIAISGIAPAAMRSAAQESGFLAGVLSFLLNHEPDLLEFCAKTGRPADSVAKAFSALPGGSLAQP